MDNDQLNQYKQRLHGYRQNIDACIKEVRKEGEGRPSIGGAEVTLAFRYLQIAKMWLGKALEETGSNLPPEFADNAVERNAKLPEKVF
jgi:hypothetical protein